MRFQRSVISSPCERAGQYESRAGAGRSSTAERVGAGGRDRRQGQNCWVQVLERRRGSSTCGRSHAEAVGDVAACRLRRPHDAHDLAALHAVVPSHGVVELDARQLRVLDLRVVGGAGVERRGVRSAGQQAGRREAPRLAPAPHHTPHRCHPPTHPPCTGPAASASPRATGCGAAAPASAW